MRPGRVTRILDRIVITFAISLAAGGCLIILLFVILALFLSMACGIHGCY